MSDEYYMEDEHEWPYLVRETRNDNKGNGNVGTSTLRRDFEGIPFSQFPAYAKRLILPPDHINNIINSIDVKAKNCTFSLHQKDFTVNIILTLKNEFLSSEFRGTYDSSSSELSFNLPFHYYEGLKSMKWFKSEVSRVEKEIGMKFYSLVRGYDFTWADERLTIEDEYDALASFSDDDIQSDTHSYKVDFEDKKLIKYHVFDWIELFDPCF